MSLKRQMVVYEDIGLYGTFVRWVRKTSEPNYVYLEYVPLNSFPPKKKILEKAIHTDFIHTIHSQHSDIAGVEAQTIKIFTNEPGSIISKVLKSDSEKTIAELREKIKKLQMQVASSKQNEEDARSGVNKTIQSMKQVSRPSPGFDNYGGGYPQGTPPSESRAYNGFEDF